MAQACPPAGTPFATWLRQRRKALDLTQEQLAAAIDVSLPTIAKIEAGQRRPSRQVAELLAHCLEVPPEEQAEFMRMARAPLDGGTPDSQPFAAAASLPAPLDRLIGRQEELAQLARLLTDDRNRLLTLTGPGGVGKTRLAIALAWQALDEFPDGVHFVSLAPLRDPALVLDAIARSLGLRDAAGSLPARLAEHLAGRQVLLVLDNFEHLLAAAPTDRARRWKAPWAGSGRRLRA
jgi:transcriptional regulator with XRE-family HTH domain